ncbi:DUF1573 domain-containing protein [Pontibacter sp. G13]|uniref:DUF1573 domain-containing protein n=1 Tax=Pontibacter sp. G13 TaxID=3074898 RepID=UPI00288A1246|nr:DUF1573 domain-containing protein [Pontibacter sp. G13]WNJ18535.1 DUF1573 domain-containing protein [Pontibacter sp. G13]
MNRLSAISLVILILLMTSYSAIGQSENLRIENEPAAGFAQTQYDLGYLQVGKATTFELTFSNPEDQPINIQYISATCNSEIHFDYPTQIEADQSATISLVITPKEAGYRLCNMVVGVSDQPDFQNTLEIIFVGYE